MQKLMSWIILVIYAQVGQDQSTWGHISELLIIISELSNTLQYTLLKYTIITMWAREREVITINNHCTIHIHTRTHLSSQNEPISLLLSNHRIYTCSVTMYMYNNPITLSQGTKKKLPICILVSDYDCIIA